MTLLHSVKTGRVPYVICAAGEDAGTSWHNTGSASVAGLLTDEDDYVQVIIDKEVAEAEWFGCNPGINTSHLKFKTKDLLQKYLPAIHHRARIVDL